MAGKCPVFKAFVLEMPILSVFQRFLASRKVSEKSGWFHYRVAGSGLSPKLKICCGQPRAGSSPAAGSKFNPESTWVLFRTFGIFVKISIWLFKNKLDNIIVLSNKMRKSKQDLRFFVVVRLAAHVSQGCKSSYLLDWRRRVKSLFIRSSAPVKRLPCLNKQAFIK